MSGSSAVEPAAIVVLGAVAIVAILGAAVFWFFLRRARAKAARADLATTLPPHASDRHYGWQQADQQKTSSDDRGTTAFGIDRRS